MRSFESLKREFREDQGRLAEEIRRAAEEELKQPKEQHELTLCLRHRSSSRAERRFSPKGTRLEQKTPVARAPMKTAHFGRSGDPKVVTEILIFLIQSLKRVSFL